MSRTGEIELLRDWFKKQLGTKEDPPNSNNIWYNTFYWGRPVSGSDYAWCVVFQWCAFYFTGLSHLFYDGGKVCRCSDLKKWAQKKGIWVTSGYRPGDLALMNTKGGSTPKHVGWIDKIDGEYAHCYEGNTSLAIKDYSNGGQVLYMPRKFKYVVGAVRIQYADYEEEDMDISKLTKDQISELKRLILPTLTDEEVYNLVQRAAAYAARLPAPDWSAEEYSKAMAAGVTDGTRPQAPVTRLEAALMAFRAGKK